MSNYTIETSRIGLRSWKESDLTPFARINADPKVMRYFPSVLTEDETLQKIKKYQGHIDEHGFGFYAVDWKERDEFIGVLGLSIARFPAFFTPCVEIGWRLDKSSWNQGLATEGAKAAMCYAYEQLRLNEIYSFTTVTNIPSQRVMQKIGMRRFGYFNHPLIESGGDLSRHVIYKSTSKQ